MTGNTFFQSICVDMRHMGWTQSEQLAYCRGIAAGIDMMPLCADAIRGMSQRVRISHPEAVACEVAVYSPDIAEPYRMTFDEFKTWTEAASE